jgi:DNA-binding transcriptional regulator PaaX
MPEYQRLKKKQLYDKLYYLNQQKYLRKIGEKYLLTDKAKKVIKMRDIEGVLKRKIGKWDKKWRIVIFDIPEIFKAKRNLLREFLGRLSFIKIQKSVWLSPYDLLGEVEELAREENLLNFILLIETKKISKYQQFEKEFFKEGI